MIQVGQISSVLDELNLMTYTFTARGTWDALTGINAPMVNQGGPTRSRGGASKLSEQLLRRPRRAPKQDDHRPALLRPVLCRGHRDEAVPRQRRRRQLLPGRGQPAVLQHRERAGEDEGVQAREDADAVRRVRRRERRGGELRRSEGDMRQGRVRQRAGHARV